MNSAVNRSNDHSTDDKTSRPTIVVPEGNKLLNFTFHTIQPQDSSKSNGFVSFISQREQKKRYSVCNAFFRTHSKLSKIQNRHDLEQQYSTPLT